MHDHRNEAEAKGARRWPSALAGVAAGSAAVLIVAPCEVWAAARGSGRFTAALLLALGLYLPLGAGVGALLGGLAAAWAGSPLGSWRSWVATLRGDPARDRQLAAALLAGAICLVLEVIAVDAFARGPAAGMANARLGALATGLVAAGVVVLLGIGAFVPLWRLALPLARWAPRTARVPAALATCGILLLLTAAAGALVLGHLDWRVLRVAPWIVLGALLLATVGGLAAASAWCGRFAFGRRWALALVPLILPVAFVPALGQREALVAQLQSGGALLPAVVALARALRDRDGDGYSAWLAGGDCDDRDPRVHPGARDVPGNGLDENCVGGDARPRAARGAAAAGTGAERAKPAALVRNLLVICIDTLRADVLGVGGHPGGLTPTLDRLARSGAYFARAYAQGPNTPQSFPSIFTSQYPSRLPFVDAFTGYPELKPEALSVFEVLQRAGLRTEAVSSHFYFDEKRGIRQGVQHWDNTGAKTLRESNKDVSAPRIVPRALARLRALETAAAPFVLFVHLFEPHSTYVPHEGVRYRQRGVAGLREKYDQEVAFVDAWLGRLLAALDASALRRDTAVVLFSDHGEAFGEHKFYFHGQALYDEVLHVPLILVAPGVAPRIVNQPVALLDVAPTLVELVGLAPPPDFQGRSLLRLARGEADRALAGRAIGAVLLPYPAWPKGQQALRVDHYKALLRLDENRFELYDLAQDPREQRDLALGPGTLAQRIKQQLADFAEAELQ